MSVAYLHGVEFLPQEAGVRPISVVRSSVILLVGVAPKGATNELILVQKNGDLAQFGKQVPGFTIPQALNDIFANQPTQVLVVNVFDPTSDVTAVVKEAVTLDNGKGKLEFCPIGALTTIYASDGTTVIPAVVGTDYKIDDFGNITVLNSTTLPDGDIKISYKKADLSGIDATAIIGDNDPDALTGMQLSLQAYSTFGFKPKQIICPGYSTLTAVAAEMAVFAERFKAIYWLDAPAATAMADIQTSRGPAGPVDTFNLGDKRGALLYPMPLALAPYTGDDETRWLSAFAAGVTAYVDATEGYHVSPSNHVIKGMTGMERKITFDFTDATGTTDANDLNSRGIVTIANDIGTGFLLWGNSSSYFPANTTPDQFICVQRVRDMTEESIAFAMRPFADKPMTIPQIDFVLETVNTFIRSLIARKALVDGSSCILDPDENTAETLAAGDVVFFLDFMGPTPGQRFTFKSRLNTSLLNNIIAGVGH